MSRSSNPCRCNCGYRCGGRGVCKDDNCGWGNETDGKEHFVRDCDHNWDGPWLKFSWGGTASCSKCDASAMAHDEMVGP